MERAPQGKFVSGRSTPTSGRKESVRERDRLGPQKLRAQVVGADGPGAHGGQRTHEAGLQTEARASPGRWNLGLETDKDFDKVLADW